MSNKLCVDALFDLFPKGFFCDRNYKVQDFLEKIGQIFQMDLDRAHDVARHFIKEHETYFVPEPQGFGPLKIEYSKNKMTVFGLETKKIFARCGQTRAGETLLKEERDKETIRKIFLEKEAHIMLEFVNA